MDQDRFNKEMDQYIRERRRKRSDYSKKDSGIDFNFDLTWIWEDIKAVFVPSEQDVTTLEEETEEEETPPEELTEEEMEQLEEELEEQGVEQSEVAEIDVPEPSLLDRFISLFSVGEEVEEFDEFDPDEYAKEESERVMFEEDVKEIIQIAHDWIEELPNEKLREFKNSDDFERYQELLDKLNLLKQDE